MGINREYSILELKILILFKNLLFQFKFHGEKYNCCTVYKGTIGIEQEQGQATKFTNGLLSKIR